MQYAINSQKHKQVLISCSVKAGKKPSRNAKIAFNPFATKGATYIWHWKLIATPRPPEISGAM